MSVKSGFSALLHKPMDRTEFMKTVGLAAIALSGVAGILAMVARHKSPTSPRGSASHSVSNYGYKKVSNTSSSKKI